MEVDSRVAENKASIDAGEDEIRRPQTGTNIRTYNGRNKIDIKLVRPRSELNAMGRLFGQIEHDPQPRSVAYHPGINDVEGRLLAKCRPAQHRRKQERYECDPRKR